MKTPLTLCFDLVLKYGSHSLTAFCFGSGYVKVFVFVWQCGTEIQWVISESITARSIATV